MFAKNIIKTKNNQFLELFSWESWLFPTSHVLSKFLIYYINFDGQRSFNDHNKGPYTLAQKIKGGTRVITISWQTIISYQMTCIPN